MAITVIFRTPVLDVFKRDEQLELPDVLAKEFIRNGYAYPVDENLCPECGEFVQFESGCINCRNCGWSKCD